MSFTDELADRYGKRVAISTKSLQLTFEELAVGIRTPSQDPLLDYFAKLEQNQSVFLQNPRDWTPPPREVEGAMTLIRTSGTSSTPKIARLSQEGLITSALNVNERLQVSGDDRYLMALPIHHVAGLAIVYRSLLAGACLVDELERATIASFVPTQLLRYSQKELSSLRTIFVGGGPLPQYTDRRIHTSYGMTEMSSTIAINGEVLPHCEVKIGEADEICVRGPSLFKGYVGQASPIDLDGWYHTSDRGEFVDGKLKILGRSDRVIISGGENVAPERIEAALLGVEGVVNAVISGAPDTRWGTRVEASVEVEKAFTELELKESLSLQLPPSHIPKRWNLIRVPIAH